MPIQTVEDFRDYLTDHMIVEPDELPVGRSCAWFANPQTGVPTMFEVSKPVPFDSYSGVLAIFQTEQVIKVYSIPLPPPTPRPSDWQDRRPTRYTLTRVAPTYVAETMTWDVLAQAVVADGNELAGGETQMMIDYIAGQSEEMLKRDELVEALEDGAHLAGDDATFTGAEPEDEEPEEATNGTTPEKPAPTPTPAQAPPS